MLMYILYLNAVRFYFVSEVTHSFFVLYAVLQHSYNVMQLSLYDRQNDHYKLFAPLLHADTVYFDKKVIPQVFPCVCNNGAWCC